MNYINPFEGEVTINPDKYYYLCSAGIGDTMLLCSFLDAVEKSLNGKVHLIIKKSHEFVLKMYDLTDYTIVNLQNIDLHKISDMCKVPQKGRIYVAHPHAHNELIEFFMPVRDQYSTIRFVPWFLRFLNLDENIKPKAPNKTPEMSAAFKERCEKLSELDKIVLISPEATSALPLPDSFWIYVVKELRKKGFTVVSNVLNPAKAIMGSCYLEMTSEEAVALGYHCHAVYSIRSGFCDVLYLLNEKLHVFYPTHSCWFLYSLNEMFENVTIDEKIVGSEWY